MEALPPRPHTGRTSRAAIWGGALAVIVAAALLIWLQPPAAAGTNYASHLPIVIAPPRPVYLPVVWRLWPLPPPVDLWVSRVEVIQGITMSDGYTVHVANRPAMLRAFVGMSGQPQQGGVMARLTRYVGGAPQDSLEAGPLTALPSPDEGALGQTLNFNLPAHWLAPGTGYVLQVDPNNTIWETNEGNNRLPGGGQQSFDFTGAPVLEVVIVPVR